MSSVTMARRLDFVRWCCFCSIRTVNQGASVLRGNDNVNKGLSLYKHPSNHKLFKTTTIMLRNLLCYCLNVLLSLLFKRKKRRETFFVHSLCRREENPSDGRLVIIRNSTE